MLIPFEMSYENYKNLAFFWKFSKLIQVSIDFSFEFLINFLALRLRPPTPTKSYFWIGNISCQKRRENSRNIKQMGWIANFSLKICKKITVGWEFYFFLKILWDFLKPSPGSEDCSPTDPKPHGSLCQLGPPPSEEIPATSLKSVEACSFFP